VTGLEVWVLGVIALDGLYDWLV